MKPSDADDPMELVGVGLGAGPDEAALAEMAWSFVEEYARLGWSGDQILRMFRSAAYRGPHHILQVKGEAFVRGLVEAVDEMRRQVRAPSGG